ncbi:TIGR02117 family protein [Pedobacter punctiformis]|uniref:TIGR02117 family protein n=1 Tax=Pedobacter punctiformis TaxID=3004097 RepID=A0ABT4L4X8_9SPHI|nr:TIGR02117 family protein [Pedobacter sp. HCMS5-2]MCZ4242974.1 TIGR02117 family protein [Pedobacter sp. HCMS5-2]
MTKKILRHTRNFLFFFIGSILLYFACAFCLSRITINKNPLNKQEIAIYIMTNGVHTDIVVPAKHLLMDWTKEIKYSNTQSADSSYHYLALGWGDKKFYLETPEFSDLKLNVALGAITGLNSSAMHATYYKNIVEDESCKKLMIDSVQYAALVGYISKSFDQDANGHFINIKTKANYDHADAFYEAVGSYSIFKTCNTWANSALKKCGQKSCLWTIFDTPIFLKYQ